MKRVCVLLAVIGLLFAVHAVEAEPINLAENWYVRITSFTLTAYPPGMEQGFGEFFSYDWSTTSLIEPKLLNPTGSSHPFGGDIYSTLYFDFHAGQAQTSDYAFLWPYATVGSQWSATMSFRWEINCSDPRLVLSVENQMGQPYEDKVWWSVPTGTGYRTGSASFMTSTWGPPSAQVPPGLVVSFAPVPEPTTLVSLLLGLGGLSVLMRRRRVDQ